MTQIVMTQARSALDADRDLKAKHRAMWALGDYPAVAPTVIPSLGRDPRPRLRVEPGRPGARRRGRLGQRRDSRPPAGRRRRRERPDPELLEVGRARAEDAGVDRDLGRGRRRGAAVRRRRVRRRAVLRRRDVRAAPPGGADELVRVCRPGGTIGLLSWTPGGFHRPDVRHDEALRARRHPPGYSHRRCGATRTMCGPCSATG